MALIWGTGSLCPCPICLVPSSKLCDHTVTHPIQNVEDAQAHIKLYEENHVAGEAALKEQGLWPVKVCPSNIYILMLSIFIIRISSGEWETQIPIK
jgi:hypothetical protein